MGLIEEATRIFATSSALVGGMRVCLGYFAGLGTVSISFDVMLRCWLWNIVRHSDEGNRIQVTCVDLLVCYLSSPRDTITLYKQNSPCDFQVSRIVKTVPSSKITFEQRKRGTLTAFGSSGT